MNLLFLPIDIDLPNITYKQFGRIEKNTFFNPWWNSTFITNESVKINKFDKILNQLPFEKISRIFHKTQRIPVGSHVDVMKQMQMDPGEYEHILSNEPCGYRLVIHGGLDKLKVKINDKWVTAQLPQTPICYLINSTTLYHSVDADPTRETIYIRGWINHEKHQALIEKSLEKYKDYAIYG